MSPLLNPRHEAFAFALAFGSTPAEAYLKAGFNPKNRKARAQPLADDPIIVNRVNELLAEEGVGDPAFARHRNAHPFTIIPQSADELAQFVWQIIKGARQVTSIQWQAIRFLGRLKRWDRSGRHEPGPDSGLSAENRESLAILDAVQIARETQLHSAGLVKNVNGDEEYDGGEFEPPALFDPDAPIYPHDPVVLTPEERDALADAEIAAESAAAELAAAEHAAQNPHSSTNVDSNPHAQLPENQPLTPENPQMWIKKEKSTSAATYPKTPAKKSVPLCLSAAKKPNTPDSVPAPDSSSPEQSLQPLPQASAARTSSLASKALATEAAAKKPNTPDPLPAPVTPKAPLPPNAAALIPRGFERQDVEWLATVLGAKAPAWVRRAFPAAESAPRPHPSPPPPRTDRVYAPHELEWLAHVMGKDTPAWVRAALRALKE